MLSGSNRANGMPAFWAATQRSAAGGITPRVGIASGISMSDRSIGAARGARFTMTEPINGGMAFQAWMVSRIGLADSVHNGSRSTTNSRQSESSMTARLASEK